MTEPVLTVGEFDFLEESAWGKGESAVHAMVRLVRMQTNNTSLTSGYIILLASIVLNGIAVHCRKAALATCSPSVVVAGICFSALLFFLITGFIWRIMGWQSGSLHCISLGRIYTVTRRASYWVLLGTLCGAAAGWVNSIAFQRYDADLVAFLMNLTMVFLILAGIFLGDRIGLRESLAILIIIGGAFIFSYRGGQFQWQAMMIVAFGCMLNTTKSIVVKVATADGDLPCFMSGALFLMMIWLLVGGAVKGELQIPDARSAMFIVLNGLLGSFLGMALLYWAYHIVGMARVAAIDALRPLAVLLIGIVILNTPIPGLIQSLGGAMILLGSAALALTSVKRPKAA